MKPRASSSSLVVLASCLVMGCEGERLLLINNSQETVSLSGGGATLTVGPKDSGSRRATLHERSARLTVQVGSASPSELTCDLDARGAVEIYVSPYGNPSCGPE